MHWIKILPRTTLILSMSLSSSLSFADINPTDILTASDGATHDNLGWSVSIDGNTAIVGAYLHDNLDVDNDGDIDTHDGPAIIDSGAAYIYVNDGFGNWTEQAKLNAYWGGGSLNTAYHNLANVGPNSLPQRNAWFGYSVAISGDIAVVSSPYYDRAAEEGIPQVDSDGDGMIDKFDAFPTDPTEQFDYDEDGIGDNSDPDANGDDILDDAGDGVLDNDTDGDGVIDSIDAFINDPTESRDSDNDGTGDNADTDADGNGIADDGDGDGKLDDDKDGDGVINVLDAFPEDSQESRDSDGDKIGDNADDDDDGDGILDDAGDGFLDEDDDLDGVMNELDALPNDATETLDTDGDGIGNNLDTDDDGDGQLDIYDPSPLDKDVVAVSSDEQDVLDTGAIYIYERTGNQWERIAQFTVKEEDTFDGLLYGTSVDIHKNTIAISSLSNNHYGSVNVLFKDTTGDWKSQFVQNTGGAFDLEEKKTLTAFDPSTEDFFGQSVAVYGNTLVVGSDASDNSESSTGSVYVYTRDINANWNIQAKLLPSDPKKFAGFGVSVDLYKNKLIVGADNADASATDDNKGAAYIFSRDVQGKWTQQEKLIASDGVANDKFGHSVALYEPIAVVGSWAKAADISLAPAVHQGAAYVYQKDLNDSWAEVDVISSTISSNFNNFGFSVGVTSIDGLSDYWIASGTPQILANDTGELQISDDIGSLIDSDGDSTANASDTDHDNDGIPNVNDRFPFDATAFSDVDMDGFPDSLDQFPNNATESYDTDSDGLGNNLDTDDDNDGQTDEIEFRFGSDPYDASSMASTVDTDGDGVIDANDAFPTDPTETIDTDGDGLGNNTDTDDDNDGVLDDNDAFPLDSTKSSASDVSDSTDTSDDSSGGGGLLGLNLLLLLLSFQLLRRKNP